MQASLLSLALVGYLLIIIIYCTFLCDHIPDNATIYDCFLRAIGVYTLELFRNKNALGVILSIVVYVIMFPALVVLLAIQVLVIVAYALKQLWKLGYKHQNH